jgi:putative copper export protein
MDEWLLGVLRLGHALAAAVWLGGTLTFALIRAPQPSEAVSEWRPLREALRSSIWVFLVTGAILSMDRLSRAAMPPIYFGVLALKVALGLWMFWAARSIGRRPDVEVASVWWRQTEWKIVLGAVVVYGLAFGLRAIYEQTLRG